MNKFKGIMFIGDIGLSKTGPGMRIDDDFLDVAARKLDYAISYARKNNLKPIIIGNLAKKRFEVPIFRRLISLLFGSSSLVIAGANEYLGASLNINPHSTVPLLAESGIVDLATERWVENITLSVNGVDKLVAVHVFPEGVCSSFVANQVNSEAINIIVSKGEKLLCNGEVAKEVAGCHLYVSDSGPYSVGLKETENTHWLNTGSLVRGKLSESSHSPKVWAWSPENGISELCVPHDQHVFDPLFEGGGLKSDAVQESYQKSEFLNLLKAQSGLANEQDAGEFIERELVGIYGEISVSLAAREIIEGLMNASGMGEVTEEG